MFGHISGTSTHNARLFFGYCRATPDLPYFGQVKSKAMLQKSAGHRHFLHYGRANSDNGRVGMACCVGPGALGSSMATANSPTAAEHVTAALLVIGDEILSGRTKDKNIGYIAEYLTAVGIDLREVRVVGDE